MESIFSNLQYKEVFDHFYAISQIPRGSGYEKAVSDYVLQYAQSLGLEAWQDEVYNVIVRKPAAPGREQDPVVMIQGHLDMVWDKTKESTHCFETDPIQVMIDGDWIHANGTTLGGDDGIAVAYAMELMRDTEHSMPALEMVLTVGEEVGLIGANALNMSALHSKYMINLDSEKDDEVLTSCAGGLRVHSEVKIHRVEPAKNYIPVEVEIFGLQGGHSGDDINKNRGNAIKLMSDFLFNWYNHDVHSKLVSMNGGSKDNAIPRNCSAKLWIPAHKKEDLDRGCWWYGEDLAKRFGNSDPGARISVHYPKAEDCQSLSWKPISAEDTGRILSYMNLCPNGVVNMSQDIDGLVETSNNMGVVTTNDEFWKLTISVRSSVEEKKQILKERIALMADLNKVSVTYSGEYPGWAYRSESPLRDLYMDSYEKLFGTVPKASAIHAGVECGLFVSAMENLDAISIGPNMQQIHSPQEKLSISSVQRVWKVLLHVLENIH